MVAQGGGTVYRYIPPHSLVLRPLPLPLPNMEYFKDDLKWEFKARKTFRVIIVGAGIAGLAAGIGEPLRCETSLHQY